MGWKSNLRTDTQLIKKESDFTLKNHEKPDGRGQYAMQSWAEARKAGGIAFTPEQIEKFLGERDDSMMTRKEVQDRISAYFQSCITLTEDEESGEFNHIWKRNPTKSGLALALGLSPGTLCDYVRGKDRKGNYYKSTGENQGLQRIATADHDLIHKAYQIITDFYEGKLADNRNNSGTIFWLLNTENRKWSNEQDIRIGEMESERPMIPASELPKLIASRYGMTVDEAMALPEPEIPEWTDNQNKESEG